MIIVGMMLVTYIPRYLPIASLSSKTLPQGVIKWLQLIPAAVLAAMLFPSLVLSHNAIDLSAHNYYLWAVVPTFLVAKLANSFVGAIIVGMGIVALARFLC